MLIYFNVFPSFNSHCGEKNMASQGWLVAVRRLQSTRCILRTAHVRSAKCLTAKEIGSKECRRELMTSILRQGEKINTSKVDFDSLHTNPETPIPVIDSCYWG